MKTDFTNNITLIILVCLVILLAQAVVVSFGGSPSVPLISAASSIILSIVAINTKNGKNED